MVADLWGARKYPSHYIIIQTGKLVATYESFELCQSLRIHSSHEMQQQGTRFSQLFANAPNKLFYFKIIQYIDGRQQLGNTPLSAFIRS
jgi:hypothetical protein